MKNVSHKSCIKTQNAHGVLNNCFLKIVSFIR